MLLPQDLVVVVVVVLRIEVVVSAIVARQE
jgi:hypothetical protein